MKLDMIALKDALYAASPFNLGSANDNKYRDAIDHVLDNHTLA